ncbi:MAG: hypothetical protein K6E33_02735 [Lachnospiraceae bacterium]|nr:hypothetical protein [Lachnospiraceae bacterium]
MSRKLSEIFSEIAPGAQVPSIFNDVSAEKISLNKDRTRLTLFIDSHHVISREQVEMLEKIVSDSLVPEYRMSVCIREHFTLS